MFEKFDDITEVYICLAPLNRMVISFDPKWDNEAVPTKHFTLEHQESTDLIRKLSDQPVVGETVQILTNVTGDDYQNSLDGKCTRELARGFLDENSGVIDF